MQLAEVMTQLEALGTEQTRKTFRRHGAKDPFFGVKVGDMKPLAKKLKGRQDLALELYDTGNGDAQYLAGMIVDGSKMTLPQLKRWARTASWGLISGNTLAWVASENHKGLDLALQWVDDSRKHVARAGWATLSAWVTVKPDDTLPIDTFRALLDRVAGEIHDARGEIAYLMNNFVICIGTYVAPLASAAIETARRMGKVEIDMGNTACKVPAAEAYIIKSRRGAPIAPKRKTVRC